MRSSYKFMLGIQDVVAHREVVPSAEVAVAFTGDDNGTNVAIIPRVGPSFSELDGVRLVLGYWLAGCWR